MSSGRGWELQHELDGGIEVLLNGRHKQTCFDEIEAKRYLRRYADPEGGAISYTEVEPDGYRTRRALR